MNTKTFQISSSDPRRPLIVHRALCIVHYALCILILLLLLASCSAPRPAVITPEAVHTRVDTVYRTTATRDTILLHDIITLNPAAETIRTDRVRLVNRLRVDTIYRATARADSIPVIVPTPPDPALQRRARLTLPLLGITGVLILYILKTRPRVQK